MLMKWWLSGSRLFDHIPTMLTYHLLQPPANATCLPLSALPYLCIKIRNGRKPVSVKVIDDEAPFDHHFSQTLIIGNKHSATTILGCL